MIEEGQLRALLDGLYADTTPPAQRAEIQKQLESIRKESGDCWKEWMLSSSDHVKFFALNLLFDILSKGQWQLQPAEERSNVKRYLFSTLRQSYHSMNSFIGRKMVMVLIAIARVEWPSDWPDLLPAIQTCFETVDTVILGITFLLQMSEEFITAPDQPSKRRDELKTELTKVVPDILQQLLYILNQTLTHLEQHANGDLVRVAVAAIGCVASYMTWIPRDKILKPSLDLIPALRGCLISSELELRTVALDVVYELCSVQYLSPASHSLTLFHGSAALLLAQLEQCVDASSVATYPEAYVQKLMNCAHTLLSIHVARLHADSNFQLLHFLHVLLKFSLMQPELSAYEETICVWAALLAWLEEQKGNCTTRRYAGAADTSAAILLQYEQFAQVLFGSMLDRLLISDASPEDLLKGARRDLEVMPISEVGAEPEEATLACYVNQSLPLLGRLACVYSDTILAAKESDGSFGALGQRFSAIMGAWQRSEGQSEELTQDVQTLLGLYCNISYEAEQEFERFFPMTSCLLATIMQFCLHLFGQRAWTRGVRFLNCTVQCINALQTYSHWMSRFQDLSEPGGGPNTPDRASFLRLLEQLVEISVNPLVLHSAAAVPDAILLASTQLFTELCAFVHSTLMLQLGPFQSLASPSCDNPLYLNTLYGRARNIPPVAWKELFKAVTFVLVGQLPPSEQAKRQAQDKMLQGFLDDLRRPMEQFLASLQGIGIETKPMDPSQLPSPKAIQALVSRYSDTNVIDMLEHTLTVADGFVVTVSCSSHATRAQLHQHLQLFYPLFTTLLNHVLLCQLHSSLPTVFTFFIDLFKSLKKQIGMEFIQSIVTLLLSYTTNPLFDLSAQSSERLLHLLEVLVSDGQSHAFIGHVAKIVVEQVGQHIQESTKSDVLHAFYLLVHTIIQRNWAYFWHFSQTPEPYQSTSPEAQSQWSQLIHLVLQPLQWQDLSPFNWNITFLKELEQSHGIFHRVFTPQENYALTAALLQVLIQRTHQLYVEDILDVLWHICNVNTHLFYNDYVREILHRTAVLSPEQKTTLSSTLLESLCALQNPHRVDYMSFCMHITDFTRDFKVFSSTNC